MMKTQGKKLAAGLTALCLAILFCVTPAAAGLAELPKLPKDTSVVDVADMLSPETEEWLDTGNGQLQDICKGATIAVLTVQDTGVLEKADYAAEAFNEWGVGDKDEDNGVLVLLMRTSPQYADGDYYVALGQGLQGTQLDSELSMILQQQMEDDFARGDYDTAVRKTVDAIAETIRQQYGVSWEDAEEDDSDGWAVLIFVLVWVGIIVLVIAMVKSSPGGKGGPGNGSGGGSGGRPIFIFNSRPRYYRRYPRYYPPRSGGFTGGFGGFGGSSGSSGSFGGSGGFGGGFGSGGGGFGGMGGGGSFGGGAGRG